MCVCMHGCAYIGTLKHSALHVTVLHIHSCSAYCSSVVKNGKGWATIFGLLVVSGVLEVAMELIYNI